MEYYRLKWHDSLYKIVDIKNLLDSKKKQSGGLFLTVTATNNKKIK